MGKLINKGGVYNIRLYNSPSAVKCFTDCPTEKCDKEVVRSFNCRSLWRAMVTRVLSDRNILKQGASQGKSRGVKVTERS